MKEKTVMIGMSGGVDSSAAAFLLKNEGYRVIGVTVRMWERMDSPALSSAADLFKKMVNDASAVCEVLGIEHRVLDFHTCFKENVIDYFVSEYKSGHTPNPCIVCNRTVKWEALLKEARDAGAEYIATGHYAHIVKNDEGRFTVLRSESPKDQSYFLYQLTQDQLAHTLFPLGNFTKEEVRGIAERAGLPVSKKKDSQEICFIPENDYARFLTSYTGEEDRPGPFVGPDGRVLGVHKGITHYTVGQRRGLGLALPEPYYVTKIDPVSNEVRLAPQEELFTHTVRAGNVNYMGCASLNGPERVLGKIRYNHKPQYAVIEAGEGNTIRCTFEKPVRAAAPGQSAVFYKDRCILCGGIIL